MSHDDFAFEPVPGLPERLPEGERILWQGRPDWIALARESLNVTWVAVYFLALAGWRFVTLLDQGTAAAALVAALPLLIMGAVVCLLLGVVAYVQARATLYTITNRRVAMRIGAALTLTLNLPFTRIGNASLSLTRQGTGTLALEPMEETRLSYLVCWPHARPWHFRKPQPALRCIPEAAQVARLLSEAAEARVATPHLGPTPLPVPAPAPTALAAE